MQQLKIGKNINELFGAVIREMPKEQLELLTLDGYRIMIYPSIMEKPVKRKHKQPKSFYGIFSNAKISDEDLEEAKKIFEYKL